MPKTTYYTRAPDGTILAGRVNDTSRFYVTEPNGHVAYLTDVNGASIGGYDYSPYGKTTVLGSANKFGARYYTTSGAFTQPDALNGNLDDPRTMTAYNYAGGDPINQQDASGMAFGAILPSADAIVGFGGTLSTLTGAQDVSQGELSLGAFAASEAIGFGVELACNFGVAAAAPATGGASLAAIGAGCGLAGIAAGEVSQKLLE